MVEDIAFTCLQINLQHATAATAAFSNRFQLLDHKIGFVQEPYATRVGDKYKISGINCGHLVYDNSKRPRACLVFGRDFQYTALSHFITQDLVAATVELKTNGFQLKQVVCSGYHAPSNEDPAVSRLLLKLIHYCRSNGLQLIYGCDANAHNQLWGSKGTDRRGSELVEYIMEHELCCTGDIIAKNNDVTTATSIKIGNGATMQCQKCIALLALHSI